MTTTATTILTRAYHLAQRAHEGQYRRNGHTPYMDHIDAVMWRSPKDPVDQAVAALHDSLEPDAAHRLTESDLDTALPGMQGVEVVDGVITLTRKSRESYETFIERVKSHRQGRWVPVKVADILSNLSDDPEIPRQVLKYARALLVLVPE